MPENDRKDRIRRLFEDAFNRGDFTLADEMVLASCVDHAPLRTGKAGREGFKERIHVYRDALAGLRFTVDDMVEESDRIAFRWTLSGTHMGPLLGVSPTGQPVEITGFNIERMRGNLIIENWSQPDLYSLLEQIGALRGEKPLPA
jgi:predicted ester cyclase